VSGVVDDRDKQAAGDKLGRKPWTLKEFGGKPVWEWMQLLIVPLALAVIGLLFEMQQAERQRALEEQQAALEDRRAKAERELAEQRAQDEALQAYLDQMSGLLLEKDLRTSEEDSEVRTLARARTATVIQRLDSDRNRNVIRFLKEAGLTSKEQSSIRLLAGADLRGANLEVTDLSDADLSVADLSDADLSSANLGFAELPEADLRRANLRGATALTDEKIAAAKSLEGATMPDGQKYEDWLKSKGRGEDGENGGTS
jgi:hypothetical protein